jgi:hypothetical protein
MNYKRYINPILNPNPGSSHMGQHCHVLVTRHMVWIANCLLVSELTTTKNYGVITNSRSWFLTTAQNKSSQFSLAVAWWPIPTCPLLMLPAGDSLTPNPWLQMSTSGPWLLCMYVLPRRRVYLSLPSNGCLWLHYSSLSVTMPQYKSHITSEMGWISVYKMEMPTYSCWAPR